MIFVVNPTKYIKSTSYNIYPCDLTGFDPDRVPTIEADSNAEGAGRTLGPHLDLHLHVPPRMIA